MVDTQHETPHLPLMFHYYGNTVRKLFMLAGAVMLISLPFIKDRIPVSVWTAVISIVIVVIIAGLVSPGHRYTAVLSGLLSAIALPVFEYEAVILKNPASDIMFWINQTLAIIFLFALYYAIKTIRGFYVKG